MPRSTLHLMAGSQQKLIESHWNFTRGECLIGVICPESRTDKRCFCLRLNSSLEMKRGFIIHKGKNGLTLDYRSNLTVQAKYQESVPSDTCIVATRTEMCSGKWVCRNNMSIVNTVNCLLFNLNIEMMIPLNNVLLIRCEGITAKL